MVAALLLGVGEMERESIRERIRAGIAARKEAGRPMGRAKGDVNHKWSLAKRRIDPVLAKSLRQQAVPVVDIAQRFGVSRVAVYAALRT